MHFIVSCHAHSVSLPVFTFGSAEKGQLGNRTMGERITTGNKTVIDIEPSCSKSPLLSIPLSSLCTAYVRELDDKNIIQIASGPQHSLVVDDTG